MEPIKIIATGGTFEKQYDEIEEKLILRDSNVPKILQKARCKAPVNLKIIKLIDSLEMDVGMRELILEECRKSKEQKIIIIHGTSLMAETSLFLGRNIEDKTIVLTGAMIPSRFPDSDAEFNLGCAFAFAQALPKGVYLAMNGRCFLWHNVRKNTQEGVFEEINPPRFK